MIWEERGKMMLLTTLAALAAPTVDVGAQLHVAPTSPSSSTGMQMGVSSSLRVSEHFAVTGSAWGQASTLRKPGDLSTPLVRLQTSSRARGAATLLADFSPLNGTVMDKPFWLDLGLGPGLVYTEDDLVGMQCVGVVTCEATARQWHPALAWAVGPRVALSDRVGMRVQARGQHWMEAFEGVTLERQSQLAVGMDVHMRLGGQPSRAMKIPTHR